jgi:NTE family protein
MREEARADWARSLSGRRVGVVLSSGFFGFYAHAGFLKAIEELGVAPAALAGSSAGALVAGLRAAGLAPREIERRLLALRREDFWESRRWLRLAAALLKGGAGWSGYLEGKAFRRLLARELPVESFEECPLPLYVPSTNITAGRRHLFSSGSLLDALHASCAYPFLFSAARIDGQDHLDGGVVDKAPLEELVLEERVEVLLVNYIPSSPRTGNGWLARPLATLGALRRALDVVRAEHADWKIRWAEARGCRCYVFCPRLPPMGPGRMDRGAEAVEAGYRETLAIIEAGSFRRPAAPRG